MIQDTDFHYMGLALEEARRAFAEGEIPIGAVVVSKGNVIASAHNMTEALTDVTAHAEMLAITAAQAALGKYLTDATIYVTVEPCTMCAGAIGWARPKRVVYGASEPRIGYTTVIARSPFHPKTEVTTGVRANEAQALMKEFFKQRR
ncbi:MAG: nucleoside deaminase [Muribaculaceae bacterium]|nr:nucleoside deaminase [Muribaculaceae bacterium]